jgi:hypothetical protein
MINFLKGLGHYMLDTYLIVLMAVQEICNSNYVLREDQLIIELHEAIKEMHGDNLVP